MKTTHHPVFNNLFFVQGVALAPVLLLGVTFWDSVILSLSVVSVSVVFRLLSRVGEPSSYLLRIFLRTVVGLTCILVIEELLLLGPIPLYSSLPIYLPIVAYNVAFVEYKFSSPSHLALQLFGFVVAVVLLGAVRELLTHGRIVLPVLEGQRGAFRDGFGPFRLFLFVSGGFLIVGYMRILLEARTARKRNSSGHHR